MFWTTFIEKYAGSYNRSLATLPEPGEVLEKEIADINARDTSKVWADRAGVTDKERDMAHAYAFLVGALAMREHLGDGIDDIHQNRLGMYKADCYAGLLKEHGVTEDQFIRGEF